MSFDQLVTEVACLSREQCKALISRLLAIGREERDVQFRRTLAEKIDDQNPAHWVPMEDVARHLGLDLEKE